jgi:hypothetical protein
MVWGAVIGAGASYLASRRSSRDAQASADRQMAFQDVQSRTQWQRAVADMKEAGINPMLATRAGPNAAMSGAMSSGFDAGQALSGGIQAGSQADLAAAQKAKVQAETQGHLLSNKIKEIRDLPKAIVEGFPDRVVSMAVDAIESYVQLADKSIAFDNTEMSEIEGLLKSLRKQSVTVFKNTLSGLDGTTRKALEGLDWFKSLVRSLGE